MRFAVAAWVGSFLMSMPSKPEGEASPPHLHPPKSIDHGKHDASYHGNHVRISTTGQLCAANADGQP